MRQRIRKGIQIYSGLLFPLLFFFLSPYVIIVSASQGILNGSAVIFGFLFLFSIVGSRLFCGWLCSAGAIQDQASCVNQRAWNSKRKNASKYVIWGIWYAFILFLWILHRPIKMDFFYLYGIEVHIIIIYFIVVTLIFIFSLCTGKRGMCHSLCWIAPFMVMGEKTADFLHIPRFRLHGDREACISCGQCSKRCPMSLAVAEMVKGNHMDSAECISCLECVDVCPKKAIGWGLKQIPIQK